LVPTWGSYSLKRTFTELPRIRGGHEGELAVDIAMLDSYHREYEG